MGMICVHLSRRLDSTSVEFELLVSSVEIMGPSLTFQTMLLPKTLSTKFYHGWFISDLAPLLEQLQQTR